MGNKASKQIQILKIKERKKRGEEVGFILTGPSWRHCDSCKQWAALPFILLPALTQKHFPFTEFFANIAVNVPKEKDQVWIGMCDLWQITIFLIHFKGLLVKMQTRNIQPNTVRTESCVGHSQLTE